MASLQRKVDGGTWYLVWKDGGRYHWKTTKTNDRGVAERILAGWHQVRAGRVAEEVLRELLACSARVPVESVRMGLNEIWGAYERTPPAMDLEPRSAASKRLAVTAFVDWMTTHHPEATAVQDVGPLTAEEYLGTFVDAAGSTRRNHLSSLRSIWASIRSQIDPSGQAINPWNGIARGKFDTIPRMAFTIEQVRRVYKAAAGAGEFWAAAVAIGYGCALRWGDICNLRWEEIDLERKRLVFSDRKTRRYGRGELSPDLTDTAIRHLPQRPESGTGSVWPDIVKLYAQNSGGLQEELRKIFSSAGIEMWRPTRPGERRRMSRVQRYGFHSLRHTFVTLLRESGLPREDVTDLVGHGNTRMTARYDHSRRAAEKAKGLLPLLDENKTDGQE